jgi:hypothetical protein
VALQKAKRASAEASARDPLDIALASRLGDFDATKNPGKVQTGEPKPSAHRIDITPARQGRYFASYLGERIAKFRVPESESARWLIASGYAAPDDKLVMCWNGRRALTDSVGWLADRTVQENEKVGPRWAKFQPFDLRPSDGPETVSRDAQDGQVGTADRGMAQTRWPGADR